MKNTTAAAVSRFLLTSPLSMLTSLTHTVLLCSLLASISRATGESEEFQSQYFPNEVREEEPETKPCSDNQQVCTSLFRYDAQTVLQEGQYCACPGCDQPTWDETDGLSITWYHHERGDRQVQYRFCDRVVPRSQCKEDRDVAVVIRTTTNSGWNPYLHKIWCQCPGGLYVLKGWMKVHEKGETFWEYTYTCKKVMCEVDRPCVRRYMDGEREKAKGYRFLCTCPESQRCPTQKGPSKKYEEVLDEAGQVYTNGYCRSLKGTADQNPSQHHPEPEVSTATQQHTEHAHAEP